MNKRICALIMAMVMMTVMMLSPSHPALGAYSDNVAGVTDARVYYANVARTGPFQLMVKLVNMRWILTMTVSRNICPSNFRLMALVMKR